MYKKIMLIKINFIYAFKSEMHKNIGLTFTDFLLGINGFQSRP